MFDPEGDFFTEIIKPLAIHTAQLIVGTNSQQLDLIGVKFIPNADDNPNYFRSSGGKLVHFTISEEGVKEWNIPASSHSLASVYAYYVYAKCQRNGMNGTIITSVSPIRLLDDDNYYHFWIGVLNSPDGGVRSWNPNYGYTEIAGQTITTGIIKDKMARLVIDLVNATITAKDGATIRGKVEFESNGKYSDLADAIKNINKATDEVNVFLGNIKDNSDNLEDFLNGAFSDNIIDEAEAIAISKYLKTLDESMTKLESTYNKLFVNAYLEGTPKTDLLNAKINLFGKRDALIQRINTAISVLSNDQSTPSQKQDAKDKVNQAFDAFNTSVGAFQNAVEEANKAIQQKLEALSDEKIRNIAFGGVNLLKNSDQFRQGWADPGISLEIVKENGADVLKVNASNPNASNGAIGGFLLDPGLDTSGLREGDDIVVSYWAKSSDSTSKPWIRISQANTFPTSAIEGRMDSNYSQFYAIGKYKSSPLSIYLGFRDMRGTYCFSKFKIEKGNKPTDWSPAPSELAKAAIIKDMEYLKTALNNDTEIDGGLILSTLIRLGMKVGNNWVEKAGISGAATQETDPVAWFGGNMSNASSLFRLDGSGRLAKGNINWDTAGNVNMENAVMKNIKATGAEIQGTVASSTVGNDRIILDASEKALQLITKNNKLMSEIRFNRDGIGNEWGYFVLNGTNGDIEMNYGALNFTVDGRTYLKIRVAGLQPYIQFYNRPLYNNVGPGCLYVDSSGYVKMKPL